MLDPLFGEVLVDRRADVGRIVYDRRLAVRLQPVSAIGIVRIHVLLRTVLGHAETAHLLALAGQPVEHRNRPQRTLAGIRFLSTNRSNVKPNGSSSGCALLYGKLVKYQSEAAL